MNLRYFFLASLALAGSSCGAAAPSRELVAAHDAYARASQSGAARFDPAGMEEAGAALRAAEAAHADAPGSGREKNLAYIAARKAELARARAAEASARLDETRALEAQGASEYDAVAQGALIERDKCEAELQQAAAALDGLDAELRAERERPAEDPSVITLTGVFFETGKVQLSPVARGQLDVVANYLVTHPQGQALIAGHADARGGVDHNRELSQRRAEMVREYLESKGVRSDQLLATGLGEANPVASNETPGGRASNRRVEVAVTGGLLGAAALSPSAGAAEGQVPSGERQNVTGRDAETPDERQNVSGQDTQEEPRQGAGPDAGPNDQPE